MPTSFEPLQSIEVVNLLTLNPLNEFQSGVFGRTTFILTSNQGWVPLEITTLVVSAGNGKNITFSLFCEFSKPFSLSNFLARNRSNILNSSLVVSQGLRWLVFHNGGAPSSLMPAFTKFRIVLCLITKKSNNQSRNQRKKNIKRKAWLFSRLFHLFFLFKEKRSVNPFHFPGLKCRTADSHGNTVISMNPFFQISSMKIYH